MGGMPSYDAIVLAGGGGRRLGGVDKAGIRVGDSTLLARALDAVAGAANRVVVGPARVLPAGVIGAWEDPPGGGPVAAIEAGLAKLAESPQAAEHATVTESAEAAEPLTVVLACDMPLISRTLVEGLVNAATSRALGDRADLATARETGRRVDGVLLVDEAGHRQPLAAVYRTDSLRDAVASLATTHDAAMRSLIADLVLVELAADRDATLDCDTWEGVARSRHLLEEA